MRMLTNIALGLLAVLGLGSCSKETESAAAPAPVQGKVLVAYFSATGNTRGVAQRAAEALKADIFEITPEQPYTAEDLDYRNENSRSYVEMHDPASRPAMAPAKVEDMDKYSVVLIGYPVWWGEAPHIVYHFVEQNNLAGKTVLPFCTSGSGGMADSDVHLAEGDPAKATWKPGNRFAADAKGEEIAAWVSSSLDKQ